MWFSAVRSELGGASAVNETTAKGVIERYKQANTGLAFSPNKQNLIVSVLCKVPEGAVAKRMDHLQERTWERSGRNQQVLGLRELQLDFVPTGCSGVWVTFLRNNLESCIDIAEFICQHFMEKVPKPEATAKKSDIVDPGSRSRRSCRCRRQRRCTATGCGRRSWSASRGR